MYDRGQQQRSIACREVSIRQPPAMVEIKEVSSLSELFLGEEENLALFNESGSCTSKEQSKLRSWQGSCDSFSGDGLLDLNGSYSVCSSSDCGDILGAKKKFSKLNFAPKRPQIVGSTLVLGPDKQSGSPRKRNNVSKQAIANRLLRSDSELSIRHRCDEVLFQGNEDSSKSQNSPRRPKRTSLREALESNNTIKPPVRRTSNTDIPPISIEQADSRPAPPSRTLSPVDQHPDDMKPNTDSATLNTSTEMSLSGHPLSPTEDNSRSSDRPLFTNRRRRMQGGTGTANDADSNNDRQSASRTSMETKEPMFFHRRKNKTSPLEAKSDRHSVTPIEKKAKSESFRLFEKDFWHPKRTGSLARLASRWKEGDEPQTTEKQPKDVAPVSPRQKIAHQSKDVAPKSPRRRNRSGDGLAKATKSRDPARSEKTKKKSRSSRKKSDPDKHLPRAPEDDSKVSATTWTSRIRRYKSKRSHSPKRARADNRAKPTHTSRNATHLEKAVVRDGQYRDTPPKSPHRAVVGSR